MPLSLIRHTTPQVAVGTCYGKTDLDVSDSFLREATQVDSVLAPVNRIVCSPLSRCRKLADFLSESRDIPVELDERLREMDFGRWEGQLWEDISRTELDEWSINFLHARSHGGESVAMLRSRVRSVVSELQADKGHTVAVTHAGVIKVAVAQGDTADDFKTGIEFGEIVTLPPGAEN